MCWARVAIYKYSVVTMPVVYGCGLVRAVKSEGAGLWICVEALDALGVSTACPGPHTSEYLTDHCHV